MTVAFRKSNGGEAAISISRKTRAGSADGSRKPSLRRILLVEDHAPLADLRRAYLEEAGFEVICARDGKQALRLLDAEVFQVVVTDATLPDASGWEVASVAKQRGLPVILSSGSPVRMRAAQARTRGVDFICPKPSSLAQLRSLIQAALRKSSRQKKKEPGAAA